MDGYEIGKEVQGLLNAVGSISRAMSDVQRRLKFIEDTKYMTKAKEDADRKRKVAGKPKPGPKR